MKNITKTLTCILLFVLTIPNLYPQHFGRNKVVYDQLEFKIFSTQNFDIYHYLQDDEEIEHFARLSELWYQRMKSIFEDTLERNPLILYNNHADFQQTQVIQQLIRVGTGGVTEGLRNRVVMPVSAARRETNHVLGHELVHAFQFNLFRRNGGRGIRSMQNIPLWLVEGKAEYLAEGSLHIHTSMWMRDAVLRDDIPTLQDMTRRPHDYFPYRYGHAFLAYFGRTFGDDLLLPLFMGSAAQGYERVIEALTDISADSISVLWANHLKEHYAPHLEGRQESVGEKLFDEYNAGNLNIAPALSPDGENLVFISNKRVITIDYYLASTKDRKISRRITGIIRDARIDEYSYLESAGSWNPQGTKFALTAFVEGRNKLLIADLERERVVNTIRLDELKAFNNPDWSPDGERIVLSGLKEGKSDLFLYNIQTEETSRLTHDQYTVLHPSWSPDGSRIVFMTDREGGTDFDQLRLGNYRLSEYDMNTGEIRVINILPGADIYNPRYSPDGRDIFFVSDADGHRNIYRYNIENHVVRKVTHLQTGVSGITGISPCFDISRDSRELVYILYKNSGYALYKVNIDELDGPVFADADVDKTPARLVAHRDEPAPVVDAYLETYPQADTEEFQEKEYEPRFTLEHIGSAGIGVGVSQFGAGMAGGASFFFSDILRENILVAAIQAEGRIIDIAGQVAYINQKSRLNWGATFQHFPYRFARGFMETDTLEGQLVERMTIMEERVFEDQLGIFAQYPLSKNLRFEGGISSTLYSFRRDSMNYYFAGGFPIDYDEQQADAPSSFFLHRTYLAYVGDQSRFGLTSPMDGYRYRLQAGRTFGEYTFWNFMADYRQYYLMHPVGLAFRLMHFGRYGQDANELQPIYLGNPNFVRGYSFRGLRDPTGRRGGGFMTIENLIGSKILVGNAEVRLPFTGPEEFALIRSRYFFTDLAWFADAGMAWFNFDEIEIQWEAVDDSNIRTPVFSTGIALRVNLFGAIILEPYYAFPFQRETEQTSGVLGFHLSFGGF